MIDVPRENKCGDGYECIPICDFCYYYDFNSDKHGVYIGLGYCRLKQEGIEPSDVCDKFLCANVKSKEDIRKPKFEEMS